jgi:hypothetical protein
MPSNKDFNVNKGIQVQGSIKLGSKIVTSFADSAQVAQVAQDSATASLISAAGGLIASTYDSADLLPAVGNTTGDFAFVNSMNRLFLWNGAGWYNIAIVNATPELTTTPNSSYTLDSIGSSIEVTIVATDPENFPITYTATPSDSGSSLVSITQDSGVFTVAPLTQAQLDSNGFSSGGTFSITFKASDGVNIAPAVSSFTLTVTTEPSYSGQSQLTLLSFPTNYADANFNFSSSIAISGNGNFVVVGTPNYDQGGSYAPNGGVAHAFMSDSNQTEYTVGGYTVGQEPSSKTSDDKFGENKSISIDSEGKRYVFGSTTYNYNSNDVGQVVIYHNEDETNPHSNVVSFANNATSFHNFAKKGQVHGPHVGAEYGYSCKLSADGSLLLVGAPSARTSTSDATTDFGRVYTYIERTSGMSNYSQGDRWGNTSSSNSPKQTIEQSSGDRVDNDRFGSAIDINKDKSYAVIGCGSTAAATPGKAYVYTISSDTLTQQAKLTPSDGVNGDGFGESVAISDDGTIVAVGSYKADNGSNSEAGAVYTFKRTGTSWSQVSKINQPSAGASMQFGFSLAMSSSGGKLFIGERKTSSVEGAVHSYNGADGAYSLDTTINSDSSESGNAFGADVSCTSDGRILAVGAPFAISSTAKGSDANGGRAYIFKAAAD